MNETADTSVLNRCFNTGLVAGLIAGLCPGLVCGGIVGGRTVRVAALRMVPILGDIHAHLERAEQLIRQFGKRGAEWSIVPEYML